MQNKKSNGKKLPADKINGLYMLGRNTFVSKYAWYIFKCTICIFVCGAVECLVTPFAKSCNFFGESMGNGDPGALVHIYRNDLSPFLK